MTTEKGVPENRVGTDPAGWGFITKDHVGFE